MKSVLLLILGTWFSGGIDSVTLMFGLDDLMVSSNINGSIIP